MPQTPELLPVEQRLPVIPPYPLAIILDGVVQQVMHVEEQTAALLLSAPTFVLIGEGVVVNAGYTYDGTSFAPATQQV